MYLNKLIAAGPRHWWNAGRPSLEAADVCARNSEMYDLSARSCGGRRDAGSV